MNWRFEKWCPECREIPVLQGKLVSNPNLEIWRCSSCDKQFEFDTWTKAAKESYGDRATV
jgi:ribosomal protein L37AE/L43A